MGIHDPQGRHNPGTKKDRLPTATRVKSANEKNTPIAGAPQHKDLTNVSNRASKSPAFPRRNDPRQISSGSLGLSVGNRVTSKHTKSK